MGYRSDVALGINFPSHDALIAFASAQRIAGDEHIREALKEYCITHHADGCILWAKFEGVKWYANCPNVMAHNILLAAAVSAGYSTFTAEIGEDLGDIKWETNWSTPKDIGTVYELFGIERRLITPEPGVRLGE